ncbi:unnamed protein product [Closterium sp. Naga37s-1]|nr:unnamed protein product [Closterium sp. Naga37s-1]
MNLDGCSGSVSEPPLIHPLLFQTQEGAMATISTVAAGDAGGADGGGGGACAAGQSHLPFPSPSSPLTHPPSVSQTQTECGARPPRYHQERHSRFHAATLEAAALTLACANMSDEGNAGIDEAKAESGEGMAGSDEGNAESDEVKARSGDAKTGSG